MDSIWIILSLIYFFSGHAVLFIVVRYPSMILPRFMKSWLILNNFILRSRGIFVSKEQNNNFYQNFEDNNNRLINKTAEENQSFRSYSIKNKIEIVKDRLLLYLKFMAYIWWIYLIVIAISKILCAIDNTLED